MSADIVRDIFLSVFDQSLFLKNDPGMENNRWKWQRGKIYFLWRLSLGGPLQHLSVATEKNRTGENQTVGSKKFS
jgi:hypothetical protein